MFPDLTFQRPLNSSINESLLLLFHDLWKVKTKHIVLLSWNTKTLNPFLGKLGLLQGGCIKRMGFYSVSEHVWN